VNTVRDEGPRLLDPTQLRSFLVVSQTLSFTQAAHRLRLSQSAVSQHVRRLESTIGRVLLTRDTHRVTLTADGEAMAGFARSILQVQDEALGFFSERAPRGHLRFGVSEDFATSRLPEVLRAFRTSHPHIDLELTVGLSGVLHRALQARELDLALVKRLPGQGHGELVFRDALAWVGAEDISIDPRAPVPLILYPPPSITRILALERLEERGRTYRTTCTASSLSGLRSAALAGLGVAPHSKSLIPQGLSVVGPQHRLPRLGDIEYVLLTRQGASPRPVQALSEAILTNQAQLQQSR